MDAQARMMFCQRCDNLLYPINNDDKEMRWLCHACHTWHYKKWVPHHFVTFDELNDDYW